MIIWTVKCKWGAGSQSPSQLIQLPIKKKSQQLFFITGIKPKTKFEVVYQYFEQFGDVKSLNIAKGTLELDEWDDGFLVKTHQIGGRLSIR